MAGPGVGRPGERGGTEHPAAPGAAMRVLLGAATGVLVVAVSWNRSRLGEPDRVWAAAATILIASLVALALPLVRRSMPTPGVLPLLLLATLVAIYACVPETDQIRQVATVVVVLVIADMAVGFLWHRSLLLSWHAGAAGLVLWAGIYGATGRQSALIGAVFAWWPVVVVPLVEVMWRRLTRAPEWTRWMITVIGAAASLVVARTGALEPTAGPAITAVAVWGSVSLAVSFAIAVSFTARSRRR